MGADSSVGVIGAGVAGVTAARTLAAAGLDVVLHERAPELGGRLGAEELAGRWVSSGCTYLSAKDPAFARQLERWVEDGVVAEWAASPHQISAPGKWAPLGGDAGGERWYVGRPHMGSLLSLTDDERARIEVRVGDVYDVNFEEGTWVVATQPPASEAELEALRLEAALDRLAEIAGLDSVESDAATESHLHSQLVVATPVHEMETFLPRKLLDEALGRGRYKDFVKERVSACFVFDAPLGLPFGFALLTCGGPITVAVCDSARAAAAADDGVEGGEGGGGLASGEVCTEVWVVQSSTEWAKRALDEERPPDEMAEELLAAFGAALGRADLPPPRARGTTVWPYGDMDYALEGGCAWLADQQLALAGDWAYNGRVEGAWLSGRAAAERLLAARAAADGA